MEYRIKQLCKEKGVTVNELSDRIGIARESLSRIISGGDTTTKTLDKIAMVLGVPVGELFDAPSSNSFNCPHCGQPITVSVK